MDCLVFSCFSLYIFPLFTSVHFFCCCCCFFERFFFLLCFSFFLHFSFFGSKFFFCAGRPLCRTTPPPDRLPLDRRKFRSFFSSSRGKFRSFFFSLGVFFLKLWPQFEAMSRPGARTKRPQRSPNVHFGRAMASNCGHNFKKKTPPQRERRRKNEICDGRGKKERNFGLPATQAPFRQAPLLRAPHPLGPHMCFCFDFLSFFIFGSREEFLPSKPVSAAACQLVVPLRVHWSRKRTAFRKSETPEQRPEQR